MRTDILKYVICLILLVFNFQHLICQLELSDIESLSNKAQIEDFLKKNNINFQHKKSGAADEFYLDPKIRVFTIGGQKISDSIENFMNKKYYGEFLQSRINLNYDKQNKITELKGIFKRKFHFEYFITFHTDFNIQDTIFEDIMLDSFTGIRHKIREIKNVGIRLIDLNAFMPPPPPQFDFPIPEYVKNTRVDYNVVENYLMTGNFLNGLEYTDSILHLKKDDIQVHKKRVIFLNKLDRYTETYESVKIICYNTAEYKYIADFGELAVLTGNYNDWILFRKNNPELKGKINDRYLMKFHDFIVNVFLNNYIDPIEYQSILDASVILKIRGWSFDLIEAYCVKNIQDSQILQKIQILIEEAEK